MATKPLDFDVRNARCRELTLHVKHNHQLAALVEQYRNTKEQIDARLRAGDITYHDPTELASLLRETGVPSVQLEQAVALVRERIYGEDLKRHEQKLVRIREKGRALADEILFRREGWVARTPIGTTYYIDFVDGLDTNDGLATGTAWKTINKYTTTTVRAAGDTAKVRANRTETMSTHIDFDEAGAAANPITIKGCSVADDPWGDASDVRPTVDAGANNYSVRLDLTEWVLDRLRFSGNTPGGYLLLIQGLEMYAYIKDCVVDGAKNACQANYYAAQVLFDNCSFTCLANGLCINAKDAFVIARNCTFNGANTADRGVVGERRGRIYLCDCNFAQTTAFGGDDIQANAGSQITGRNVKFGGSPNFYVYQTPVGSLGYITIEDYNSVLGDHRTWFQAGTLFKVNTPIRPGGAPSSAHIGNLNSYLNNRYPMRLSADSICSGDLTVWSPAKAQQVTMYLYGNGWGSNFPTAAELWLEASYLSSASNANRTIVKSTQVLAANQVWTAFTTSFTPQQEGWVFLSVLLTKYVSGAEVYVDIRPVMA